MPLGPRGVPAGHGAVPVRRTTVPGAPLTGVRPPGLAGSESGRLATIVGPVGAVGALTGVAGTGVGVTGREGLRRRTPVERLGGAE